MSNTRSGPRWKNNLRYLVATLSAAGAAYAVDRWFLSGVMASKWIGLPQYASAMSQLQMESRHWGIAALVAEGLAVLLVLPRWAKEKRTPIATSVLTAPREENLRLGYFWKCILRVGFCLGGTLLAAISVPLIIGIFFKGY
jgi:hypothetical protein